MSTSGGVSPTIHVEGGLTPSPAGENLYYSIGRQPVLPFSRRQSMMLFVAILGFIGHAVLWVMLVNRVHGMGIDRRWIEVLTYFCIAICGLLAISVGLVLWLDMGDAAAAPGRLAELAAWTYLTCCALVLIVAVVQRLRIALHPERRAAVLVSNHTTDIDLRRSEQPLAAPGLPRILSQLPGNQVLHVHLHNKKLVIPRLSEQHAGIRIAHLSDLHMSGRIDRQYFSRVVDEVNQWGADLVAVTGDIVDRDACIDWMPETLGRLQAEFGVYYVLGNHDRRVDFARLHKVLGELGHVHLGGAWRELDVRGVPVILAGNELPWFAPAADMSDCPPHGENGLPLRILLAHTPDHFRWAQERDIDLVLAGHNHGGQVRLPILGPILAPSRFGVRYSSGTFCTGNTVMHVSRGTSNHAPLRWNCPPEASELTLCAGK